MVNKAHRIRIVLYSLLTAFFMCFIYAMSAQNGESSGFLSDSFLASVIGQALEHILPRLSSQGAGYDIRKYAHMAEYLCLGVSSCLLFLEIERMERPTGKALLSALLFCFLYACTDEWHQTFVPGRVGAFSDVMIDSAGSALGICMISTIKLAKRLDKRQKKG